MFKLRKLRKAATRYDHYINYDPEIIKNIIPDCIKDMESLQELTDEYIDKQNNILEKWYKKYDMFCFIYSADALSQSFLFLYSNLIIYMLCRLFINLSIAGNCKKKFSQFLKRLYQFKYFRS